MIKEIILIGDEIESFEDVKYIYFKDTIDFSRLDTLIQASNSIYFRTRVTDKAFTFKSYIIQSKTLKLFRDGIIEKTVDQYPNREDSPVG